MNPHVALAPREVVSLSTSAAWRGAKMFARDNRGLCAAFACAFLLLSLFTGTHPLTLLWFFLLGISSSIGLGVGVPSRILFLIPYILSHASTGGFLTDYARIFPVCFIHAVGSAVGELPPFLSASTLVHYFQLQTGSGMMARFHQWVMSKMQSRRFTCIVLLATWPNATFDACGLSAGASGMGTRSFLLATTIGKACIRAPLTLALILTNVHSAWMARMLPLEWWQEQRQKKGSAVGLLWTAAVTFICFYTLWITMAESAKIEKDRMNALMRHQKNPMRKEGIHRE